MTQSTSTRKIISIFLSIILVIGTLTAYVPSISMTKAHALSEYGEMTTNSNDNYKSTKHSSFEKDNIECNNFNLNLNGLDVDAIPESLIVYYKHNQKQKTQILTSVIFGNDAERHVGYQDKDKGFLVGCIYNNDNEEPVNNVLLLV